MMGKNEKIKGMKRVAVGASMGAAVTLIASMCLIMPWAAFVASGRVGEEVSGPLVVVTAFLASCLGSFTAKKWSRQAALVTCIGTAVICIFVRLITAMIAEGSGGLDSLDLGISAALVLAAALVGAIKKGRRRGRR